MAVDKTPKEKPVSDDAKAILEDARKIALPESDPEAKYKAELDELRAQAAALQLVVNNYTPKDTKEVAALGKKKILGPSVHYGNKNIRS